MTHTWCAVAAMVGVGVVRADGSPTQPPFFGSDRPNLCIVMRNPSPRLLRGPSRGFQRADRLGSRSRGLLIASNSAFQLSLEGHVQKLCSPFEVPRHIVATEMGGEGRVDPRLVIRSVVLRSDLDSVSYSRLRTAKAEPTPRSEFHQRSKTLACPFDGGASHMPRKIASSYGRIGPEHSIKAEPCHHLILEGL